jgi:hypothetical protein
MNETRFFLCKAPLPIGSLWRFVSISMSPWGKTNPFPPEKPITLHKIALHCMSQGQTWFSATCLQACQLASVDYSSTQARKRIVYMIVTLNKSYSGMAEEFGGHPLRHR